MIVNPQYGQRTAGSGGPIHGTVYLGPGTTSWTVPPGVTLLDTVDLWGPGQPRSFNTAGGGGGGAFSRRYNVPVTPGQVINVNIPTQNTLTTAVYTWFDSITVQKAASASQAGAGGLASDSIGDVVYSGGSTGSNRRGAGGGGAAGPLGNGADGGSNQDRGSPSGGGGGANNGTAGATPPGGSGLGGTGGSNGLGQVGGLSGLPGVNPGSGGGGAANFNNNAQQVGGNGADDPDGGGGGGGGGGQDAGGTLPMTPGNGGQPGGGAGGFDGGIDGTVEGTGGDGQIKIVF